MYDDGIEDIQDILIQGNNFQNTNFPIYFGLNQRAVNFLKIKSNTFSKSKTAISFDSGAPFGLKLGDGVVISYNYFKNNILAINACINGFGSGMGTGGPYVFSVTKNTFINDIASIKFNYFRYANLSKNIFIGVSKSIFVSGSEWSSTNNNTIEFNQFINLDSAIELNGVYTYDQPENNLFKKNIFQTFLKNQKKSLIKTNLKINTNIFQENNFSLYDSFIIKNTDIGNIPFTGNYTMPSRTLANDIYDQIDNIDLGLV